MGVNTGTNRSRGGLLVQDNNTTTPEDTVFAYGVREIIVTTGTLTNNGQGTVTITTGGGGGGGSGTVTSVTLNAATTGLTISGGTSQTITTSGTFTLGGTLVPANGGTGMNTYNKGDLIVGGTTNPLETLGTGGRTAGDFLTIKAGALQNFNGLLCYLLSMVEQVLLPMLKVILFTLTQEVFFLNSLLEVQEMF